jgi:sec-independent protein translocase protein TatB
MPDIGFSELLIVVFIAIVVLGPEKLPEAMVKLGRFVGKIRRMWDDATRDIKKEIELEEMKEEMQKYKKQLEDLQRKVDDDINKGLTSLDELTELGNRKIEIK